MVLWIIKFRITIRPLNELYNLKYIFELLDLFRSQIC